jgi:methylmalonyl-CoA mutase N-terminal domain/subunit
MRGVHRPRDDARMRRVVDMAHYKREQNLRARAKAAHLSEHGAIAFEALALALADPYASVDTNAKRQDTK